MKKPFLLLAGDAYYPAPRCQDWVKCFETAEDAEKHLLKMERETYDWFEIVDLREWAEK